MAVTQASDRRSSMDSLLGSYMKEREERDIARLFPVHVCLPLKLRRVTVVLSFGRLECPEPFYSIEDAADEGRITDQQLHRIVNTDLVFTAQRRVQGSESVPVWCAVEISTTIREDDISRARQSAEALKAAVGIDTLAIVAGAAITERAQRLLDYQDVSYMPTPLYESPISNDGSDNGGRSTTSNKERQ